MTASATGWKPGQQMLAKVLGVATILLQIAVLAGTSDAIPLVLLGLSVVTAVALVFVHDQQDNSRDQTDSTGKWKHPATTGTNTRVDKAVAGTLEIVQASLDHNVRQQSLIDRTRQVLEGSESDVHLLLRENAAMKAEVRTLEVRLRSLYKEAGQLRDELETTKSETFVDGLTKLKNRKWFDVRLSEEIKRANDTGLPLTLALVDLDKFKAINDTYGHVTGDRILQWAAERLIQNVKGRDSAARYGGEEFAIILPQTKISDAVALLEQIRSQFETVEWTHARTGRNMGRVTASFGAAQLMPAERPEDLIERADKNLYSAKAAGRNQVVAR